MKNKNENRTQLLQRFVNKSHQVMDDIAKLTVQIQATYPGINMYIDETPLFIHNSSKPDSREMQI